MSQVEVNPGWEERYEAIKGRVYIQLYPAPILRSLLSDGLITDSEYKRAIWKIHLIEPFVTRQVMNMIKGTLKYPTDDWSDEVWKDMGLDDKADSVNYDLLRDRAQHLAQTGQPYDII